MTGQVIVGKANFFTASSSITCPLLLTTATMVWWYKEKWCHGIKTNERRRSSCLSTSSHTPFSFATHAIWTLVLMLLTWIPSLPLANSGARYRLRSLHCADINASDLRYPRYLLRSLTLVNSCQVSTSLLLATNHSPEGSTDSRVIGIMPSSGDNLSRRYVSYHRWFDYSC